MEESIQMNESTQMAFNKVKYALNYYDNLKSQELRAVNFYKILLFKIIRLIAICLKNSLRTRNPEYNNFNYSII